LDFLRLMMRVFITGLEKPAADRAGNRETGAGRVLPCAWERKLERPNARQGIRPAALP
jgi:hypothetical protein